MADFTRKPAGSRFTFLGMKLNAAPDALPEHKYGYAKNVRGYYADQVTSRPPWLLLTAAPAPPGPTLTLEPALGIYKIGTAIYLNSTQITAGFSALGCSLIPFRPNESPSAWEYVFDSNQQVKVLPNPAAPATSIVKKVGIAEPQLPCDAVVSQEVVVLFNVGAGSGAFTHTGTAGAASNAARLTDTVVAAFQDPLTPNWSVQVASNVPYQRHMIVTIGSQQFHVNDVFPGNIQSVAIAGIYYYAGTTGHCVVVPQNVNAGPGDAGIALSQQQLIGSLRRGSLIELNSEVCYVWSVTEGPDGTVCIETSTTGAHTTADLLAAVPAIQVIGGIPTAAQAITSPGILFNITVGIGSQQTPLTAPFFAFNNFSYQDEDFIHISINVDNPNNLISCRVAFDVSDGTFTKDYYYYEIRPSDLQPALTGVAATQLTQLAVAQLLGQRASIDSEDAVAYNNEIFSDTGSQLIPGSGSIGTWTEVVFPISALTRVGNDQTKTIANAAEFAFSVNAAGTMNIAVNSIMVLGGFHVDSGSSLPYQYRYRARDSQTGVSSNWSPTMRYTTSPRRQLVEVILPGSFPDPQADTFDVERQGGALEDWTYTGSVTIGNNFFDNYGDDRIADNDVLPEDNYEPFPSIGPPLSTNAGGAALTGYVAILKFPSASVNQTFLKFANLLPGNLLQVGQQVYTTYSRPIQVSVAGGVTTYLIYLVENAGVIAGATATILEPALANQTLAQVWGPDDNGCLFAAGDKLRPGGVYNTNPHNPDGCNEGVSFNELCAPTEPLVNGELIQQTSCVASTKRWWAGRSGQDALGNLKYDWIEIPVGRGLAAPFGVCTDGNNIYFIGPDGIYSHSGGPASSLTDDDLYPLFPHEGIFPGNQPQNIRTLSGYIVSAPDYRQAQTFRLATANGFLFFDYLDSTGVYRTLTCNLATRAWCVDTGPPSGLQLTVHAATIAAVSPAPGTATAQVYAADGSGNIWTPNSSPVAGAGEIVSCVLQTRDETGDDVRASKLFGDAMIDSLPLSAITIEPILFGVSQPNVVIPAGLSRVPAAPIDIGGEAIAQSMGLVIAWNDQGVASILYAWQVSWVPQPESTEGRFTDWDGGPGGRNLFFQGFELEADTRNAVKAIKVRDADTLTLHPFNSAAGQDKVQHNGQQTLPYSFLAPFQAHLVRLEPQDSVSWRMFRVRWITRPTPDSAINWITQPTSYGLPGYHHVHHALFAYQSTAAVTLTITTDGVPAVYQLPSTGGAYKKVLVMFAAIKGLVDIWSAVSAAQFQVWQDDIEIFVKAWGDPAPYRNARLLGAPMTPDADI